MPTWLVSWLISLAIKYGAAWLLQKFPWLPKDIAEIIKWLIDELKKPNVSNSVAKKTAIAKVKECYGTACPTELK